MNIYEKKEGEEEEDLFRSSVFAVENEDNHINYPHSMPLMQSPSMPLKQQIVFILLIQR
jgi:hypothetical protein